MISGLAFSTILTLVLIPVLLALPTVTLLPAGRWVLGLFTGRRKPRGVGVPVTGTAGAAVGATASIAAQSEAADVVALQPKAKVSESKPEPSNIDYASAAE